MSTAASQTAPQSAVSSTNPNPASAGLQFLRDLFATKLPNPLTPEGHFHVAITTNLDMIPADERELFATCEVLPNEEDVAAYFEELKGSFTQSFGEEAVGLQLSPNRLRHREGLGEVLSFCFKWDCTSSADGDPSLDELFSAVFGGSGVRIVVIGG